MKQIEFVAQASALINIAVPSVIMLRDIDPIANAAIIIQRISART